MEQMPDKGMAENKKKKEKCASHHCIENPILYLWDNTLTLLL